MGAMAILPSPAALLDLGRTTVGRVLESAASLATVPVRVHSLLSQAELLVSRITVITEQAEALVHRVAAVTGEAEDAARESRAIAAAAALAVEEAAAVTVSVTRVVDGAAMPRGPSSTRRPRWPARRRAWSARPARRRPRPGNCWTGTRRRCGRRRRWPPGS
jgi:hypothetical protein